MKFILRMRFFSLIAMSLAIGLPSLPPAAGQAPKEKRFDQRTNQDLGKRQKEFRPLQLASERKGNIVEVTLKVSVMVHKIDRDALGTEKDQIRTRSYNEKLCGPVIRVKPGDLLKIRLQNDIKKTDPDTPFDPGNPTAPHGFNVTNLHTHGLNVSPLGRGDNVFLEVGPEEWIDLCFDIPRDHPAGTFWFHAHKHGSVALQLAGGMAGVLIVDGGADSLDGVPQVAAATKKEHEKILVFQQIPYRPDPTGKVVDVTAEDVYADPVVKSKLAKDDTLVRNTLINGELHPTITMQPGEVQRWRCVHAGLEGTLDLALVHKDTDPQKKEDRVKLHEIAVDGLPFGTLQEWSHVELQPGYRSDLLVKAPAVGTYYLVALPVAAEKSVAGVEQNQRWLATVEVKGPALQPEMELPQAKDLADYPDKAGLKRITDKEVANAGAIHLKFRTETAMDGKENKFHVNGKPFSKDVILLRPKLDTAEEWTLESEAGRHPFHIHVNPFQVVRLDESGKEQYVWRDTLLLSADDAEATKLRMRFKNYPGKTVLHCHNLRHEDQGMMAAIDIDGMPPASKCSDPPPAGFKKLPASAPAWDLTDGNGNTHRSTDFHGKKLLVFSRGSDCVHCRAQIQALTAREKELAAAGVAVVVICPVPAKMLAATNHPFLILADPAATAFRAYHCHDGRALHGTFLIDANNQVRWQNAGDEPFMDVAALLKAATALK